MFHEINQDKIDRVRGMDITVVTTAKNDEEGRALLKQLGFPFARPTHRPDNRALAVEQARCIGELLQKSTRTL